MRDSKVTFRLDVYFDGNIKAYAVNYRPVLWFFWQKTHQTLIFEGTNQQEIIQHIKDYVKRSRATEIRYTIDLDDRGEQDLCYF